MSEAQVKPIQEKIFDFIVKFKREHDGNSPTIRDIGAACGISSTSMVVNYLHKLKEAGQIALTDRLLIVVGGEWIPPTRVANQ